MAHRPYPFRGLHKHVRRVYDAFGPRRMLWGTDYSRLTVPYRDAVGLDPRSRACAEWVGWPA